MTVNQLNKLLQRLVKQGRGRMQVCVDKQTFHHNCESDGVVILEVNVAELEWVPLADDDDGTAFDSKGRERGSTNLVLFGDSYEPLTKQNANRYRIRGRDGWCANCGRHVETHPAKCRPDSAGDGNG